MIEDFVPIAGQPFDPLAAANNRRYVVDLVEASRSLADGPKRLYSTLWRLAITLNRNRNPWPGYLFPSESHLADRLGKNVQSVRRDMAKLSDLKLIEVNRPNKRLHNQYLFLWHAGFDASKIKGEKNSFDLSEVIDQKADQRKKRKPGNAPPKADSKQVDDSNLSVSPIKSDTSRPFKSDSSLVSNRSHEVESRKKDLDCLPGNRKKRDSGADVALRVSEPKPKPKPKPYPKLKKALESYRGMPVNDDIVAKLMDCADGASEDEVVECLVHYYHGRGLKPGVTNAPESWSWFLTTVQGYFSDKRARAEAADPSGYYEWEDRNDTKEARKQSGLTKAQFDKMTEAF